MSPGLAPACCNALCVHYSFNVPADAPRFKALTVRSTGRVIHGTTPRVFERHLYKRGDLIVGHLCDVCHNAVMMMRGEG